MLRRQETPTSKRLFAAETCTGFEKVYSEITSHRALKASKPLLTHVASSNQAYFSFQMTDHLFPIRIYLRQVSSHALLYVGYDRPHPGVEIKGERLCDYKIPIKQDTIVTLANPSSKRISCLYFTLEAQQNLLAVTIKVEPAFIRANTQPAEESPLNELKFKYSESVAKLLMKSKVELLEINKKNEKEIRLLKTEPRASKGFESRESSFKISPKKNNRNNSFIESKDKIEKIKENIRARELNTIKQREMKEVSSKIKMLIQNYQENFIENKDKSKLLTHFLATCLYVCKFVGETTSEYNNTNLSLNSAAKVHILSRRFATKIKMAYKKTRNEIPMLEARNTVSLITNVHFLSKVMIGPATKKATEVIIGVLFQLKSAFEINMVFRQSKKYRSCVRVIQRFWLAKYHSRKHCLELAANQHIEKMLKEYPHLKIFHDSFIKEKVNEKLVYEYMKEESLKFVHIHNAYLLKKEETEQFNKIFLDEKNKKIKNKKEIERISTLDHEEVVVIPKEPRHRFFRNTEILKAMVRSWFEIERKKWLKKQTGVER